MIPDSFIQSLLERVDVADVVGRYVQLRKAGANLLGLCPFHGEKTPSFTVSPTKQFYHCFGCGAHGSAIRFLMEHVGASFPEAVRQLADSVGMRVPEEPRTPMTREARVESARRREAQSRHTQVLEAADVKYRRDLRTARGAIDYLKGRGLSGQIAARYGLGWAGSDRHGLASIFPDYDKPDFAALLVESGLVIQSEDGRRYDRFRERVMFPIRNARGHLVGFGGRVLGKGEPKYLNSPETPVFSKGSELYGLWEARQAIRNAGQVVVVEGYMDVVALAQMGVENAVATLGTATTTQHVQKLLRAADQIVFSFDGDAAGRRAAWRALQSCLPLLRDDIAIHFLFLPAEHDPDSYVREHGADAFREAMREAPSLSRFMLDEWARQHDLAQPEGRARCVHDAQPLMQAMPKIALRLQVQRELAGMVRLTPEELDTLLALEDEPSGPLVNAGRRTLAAAPAAELPGAPASGAGPAPASAPGAAPDMDVPPMHDDIGYVPEFSEPYDPPEAFYPDHPPGGQGAGGRRWQGERSGGKRWQGKGGGRFRGRDWDDEPRDPPGSRRPVPSLSQRLLQLLIVHPELIGGIDAEVETRLAAQREYGLVCDMIRVVRGCGAQHTGAILEAISGSELEEDLIHVAADTLLAEDLPDPDAELRDTLRSILLRALQAEQSALAAKVASDPAALEAYRRNAEEILRLRAAG
ncbi:DNA primase [Verticiella sediminum]|uniref:DNA primase n=1 Tax=Verticiella sediminum TaxID=1247510 RepID=A0A556AQ15_9BURK|nr:DNA primase [Verticiella sediminum]TSH94994.1 DNA primase [Verticiella sediminum]